MLCELDDVRGFLQRPPGETEQDEQIAILCAAVGPVIAQFCEREFEQPSDNDLIREFEYSGGGYLSLAPYDLRELTQIRMDVDESSPVTLTTEEFRLPPSPTGTYTYIKLAPYLVHSRSRWQQRLVEVTGKWGFEEVPADVKQAAVITVAIWMRRDVAAFSTTLKLDEERVERPEALPSAAAKMLAPYKRQGYA